MKNRSRNILLHWCTHAFPSINFVFLNHSLIQHKCLFSKCTTDFMDFRHFNPRKNGENNIWNVFSQSLAAVRAMFVAKTAQWSEASRTILLCIIFSIAKCGIGQKRTPEVHFCELGASTTALLINWSTSELNRQLNPTTCLGDTGCWIQLSI